MSLLLVLPTPRRGDTLVAPGSRNGWDPPGASEREPEGQAKRCQTRMLGGVGERVQSPFLPDSADFSG